MKLASCILAACIAVTAAGQHQQHQQHHDACDDGHPTPAPTTTSPPVTSSPSGKPTMVPTHAPTVVPTGKPTHAPTDAPTGKPTHAPTDAPTGKPTHAPTDAPTGKPTHAPTDAPTGKPTHAPTDAPTGKPTQAPTDAPTPTPTDAPSITPTASPSPTPTTQAPTEEPTPAPTTLSPAIPMPDNSFDENKSYDWFDLCKGEIWSRHSEMDDADCRESFWYVREHHEPRHACFKCAKDYAFDMTKSPYIMCDSLPICGGFDDIVDLTPKQLKCLYENNGNQTTWDACKVF